MILKGTKQSYEVGKQVAETPGYRLYLCVDEKGRECLLQVAITLDDNAALDRAAYVLERLLQQADRLEKEYEGVKENPKHFLNYQLTFPAIEDSFILEEQGGRRVNILSFRNVDDVRNMVPLWNIINRDNQQVNPRTSVWIMGKLLKILTFVHSAGITIGNLSPGNILIEPNEHYVVIFNWADAQLNPGGVTRSKVSEEIRAATSTVIELLGGTPEGDIPDDGTKECAVYAAHLKSLATKGGSQALKAHGEFYSLVDGLWERGFYPFTSMPRETGGGES